MREGSQLFLSGGNHVRSDWLGGDNAGIHRREHSRTGSNANDVTLAGPVPISLSDQHSNLIGRVVGPTETLSYIRRYSGQLPGSARRAGLRLDMVPRRVADGRGWSKSVARATGLGRGIPRCAA